MLVWIADKLGLASMAPFWRPSVALALSATGSLLTWIASELPWAEIIFAVSIALAIWAWAESLGGALAGFAASLFGFYLVLGTNTSLNIFHRMPNGCVMIDGRDPSDCIDAWTRGEGSPPIGTLGRP